MRTLFIGGTKRGYLTLKTLLESGAEIVGVISLRQDDHKVTIWSVAPVNPASRYSGRIPERVVAIGRESGSVDVLTGDGVIRIFELQFEGEERAPAASRIRSLRGTFGLRPHEVHAHLEGLERKVEALSKVLQTEKRASVQDHRPTGSGAVPSTTSKIPLTKPSIGAEELKP